MNSKLYIPKTLTIGFNKINENEESYSDKLAYIIYIDDKGVLRKEKSWNSWRDHKIEVIEVENKPSAGFVLNKGGQRCNYRFGGGRSFIRVYDDRDFEFEISVDNLMGILMHSDVSKRDIIEECVYAWSGKNLILLPVNSEQYKEAVKFTDKQAKNISAKDLVKGYTYVNKKNKNNLIYIGREFFINNDEYEIFLQKEVGKKHVFYDLSNKKYISVLISQLAECVAEDVYPDYADLYTSFIDSPFHKIISDVILEELNIEYFNKKTKTYDNDIHKCFCIELFKREGNELIKFETHYYPDENLFHFIRFTIYNKNLTRTFICHKNSLAFKENFMKKFNDLFLAFPKNKTINLEELTKKINNNKLKLKTGMVFK